MQLMKFCATRRLQDVQVDVASGSAGGVSDNNGISALVSEANVCQDKEGIGFARKFPSILEPLVTRLRGTVSDEAE